MDGFIGEIRAFGFDYEPQGWMFCNGQSLPTANYQTLFSILGNMYGGSGTSFNLPNIPGKVLVGSGQLHYNNQSVGNTYAVGNKRTIGETITLGTSNMPPHSHAFNVAYVNGSPYGSIVKVPASGSWVSNFGTDTTPIKGGKGYCPVTLDIKTLHPQTVGPYGNVTPTAHENMQPYLALNYCICLEGEYPTKP